MTDRFLEIFIKNHENISDPSVRASYGLFSGIFGICCNTFLAIVKVVLGLVTGSISIAADATNNLSDSEEKKDLIKDASISIVKGFLQSLLTENILTDTAGLNT